MCNICSLFQVKSIVYNSVVSNGVRPILCVICVPRPRQTSFFLSAAFFVSIFIASIFGYSAKLCFYVIIILAHSTYMPINTMADFRMRKYNFHLMFSLVRLLFSTYAVRYMCTSYADMVMVLRPITYNDTIPISFMNPFVYIVLPAVAGEPTIPIYTFN